MNKAELRETGQKKPCQDKGKTKMFTIKWCDSSYGYNHKVTFDDGWQRLNSCNAATFEKSFECKNKSFTTYYLQSYATPIIHVISVFDKTTYDNRVYVCVNKEMWNTSQTTIKHISKFCFNLYLFGNVPIDYFIVKDAMKWLAKHSDNVEFKRQNGVTIIPESDANMRDLFASDCPRTF